MSKSLLGNIPDEVYYLIVGAIVCIITWVLMSAAGSNSETTGLVTLMIVLIVIAIVGFSLASRLI